MTHDDAGKKNPPAGFLFRTSRPNSKLDSKDRAALVRKGNEFFNNGNLAAARRVYITTGYGDGLIRMGDHYYKQKEFLEAFHMYWLGKEKQKCDNLIERMVVVIREWLNEGVAKEPGKQEEND
ncbi:MAG: hypothetical protein LBQ57_07715 [Spirochaetales bacterium]|jgi:hypothetical protein|nr:hypothetical protein [Spirochaetales bacterium]